MNAVSDRADTDAGATGASGPAPRRRRRAGVGRRVALVLGCVLLALALAAFAYELWAATATGAYRVIPAGELWYTLHRGSLNLSQAVTQRYVHPWLWEPGIVTLLYWPAWSLLGALGVVLVLIALIRRSS